VVVGIKEHGMLGVCPVKTVETMLERTTAQLESLREVIDKSKETKGE
jgi:hypothetical protein